MEGRERAGDRGITGGRVAGRERDNGKESGRKREG